MKTLEQFIKEAEEDKFEWEFCPDVPAKHTIHYGITKDKKYVFKLKFHAWGKVNKKTYASVKYLKNIEGLKPWEIFKKDNEEQEIQLKKEQEIINNILDSAKISDELFKYLSSFNKEWEQNDEDRDEYYNNLYKEMYNIDFKYDNIIFQIKGFEGYLLLPLYFGSCSLCDSFYEAVEKNQITELSKSYVCQTKIFKTEYDRKRYISFRYENKIIE